MDKPPPTKPTLGTDSDNNDSVEPESSLADYLCSLPPFPETPGYTGIHFTPPDARNESDTGSQALAPKEYAEDGTVPREDAAQNVIEQRFGRQSGEARPHSSEASGRTEDTKRNSKAEPYTRQHEHARSEAPLVDKNKYERGQGEDTRTTKGRAASEELQQSLLTKDERSSADKDSSSIAARGSREHHSGGGESTGIKCARGGGTNRNREEAGPVPTTSLEPMGVDEQSSEKSRWAMWKDCLSKQPIQTGRQLRCPPPGEAGPLPFTRRFQNMFRERQEISRSLSKDNKVDQGELKETSKELRAPVRRLLEDLEAEAPTPSTSQGSESNLVAVATEAPTVPCNPNQPSRPLDLSAVRKIAFAEDASSPRRSPLIIPASPVSISSRPRTQPCGPMQKACSSVLPAVRKIEFPEDASPPRISSSPRRISASVVKPQCKLPDATRPSADRAVRKIDFSEPSGPLSQDSSAFQGRSVCKRDLSSVLDTAVDGTAIRSPVPKRRAEGMEGNNESQAAPHANIPCLKPDILTGEGRSAFVMYSRASSQRMLGAAPATVSTVVPRMPTQQIPGSSALAGNVRWEPIASPPDSDAGSVDECRDSACSKLSGTDTTKSSNSEDASSSTLSGIRSSDSYLEFTNDDTSSDSVFEAAASTAMIYSVSKTKASLPCHDNNNSEVLSILGKMATTIAQISPIMSRRSSPSGDTYGIAGSIAVSSLITTTKDNAATSGTAFPGTNKPVADSSSGRVDDVCRVEGRRIGSEVVEASSSKRASTTDVDLSLNDSQRSGKDDHTFGKGVPKVSESEVSTGSGASAFDNPYVQAFVLDPGNNDTSVVAAPFSTETGGDMRSFEDDVRSEVKGTHDKESTGSDSDGT